MNWKKGFLLGLISAALSSIACLIYNKLYSEAFLVDFSKVLNAQGIIASSLLSSIIMSAGYVLFNKWKGDLLLPWANIFYSVVSFASIAGVLTFNLPLEIEFPEMFPGLAIPMHFFPLLAFLLVYPFFRKKEI